MVRVFETSRSGDRLREVQLKFGSKVRSNVTLKHSINIDRTKKYQKIIGFGGAFTEASGLNIKTLPKELQNNIINDYFGENGLQYNLGRIPIGGSDFSTRAYTYDDDHSGDLEWKYWNLTKEDYLYKVCVQELSYLTLNNKWLSLSIHKQFPYMKAAKRANPNVKFFGSSWAPPLWLKTNGKINNGGYLLGEPGSVEYKAYANYLVK